MEGELPRLINAKLNVPSLRPWDTVSLKESLQDMK